jgi:hypothetical protein
MTKKKAEVTNKPWQEHWQDMPEFVQEDLRSFRKIVVHFRNQEDVDAFAELIGQTLSPKQPSTWFPKQEHRKASHLRYEDEP